MYVIFCIYILHLYVDFYVYFIFICNLILCIHILYLYVHLVFVVSCACISLYILCLSAQSDVKIVAHLKLQTKRTM